MLPAHSIMVIKTRCARWGALCLLGTLVATWGLAAPTLAFSGTPVAAAPAQTSSIPTPESVLGFAVGDDFKLASYDESLAYFRELDAATDRLQLMEVGLTSEGRRWYVALISSAENLAGLERYRAISQRLAHPEGLSDIEARALAQEGRAFVSIDGGLHATETAHGQHTIQLAYDLITEKDGDVSRAILDAVILVLWFSINPDGQNMVVDWYRQNMGTEYEIAPMPWLYQKYIGHDNNRDGYGLNMIESRVAVRTKRYFEPQVLYSHHMTAPGVSTIWLPPYAEPISPFLNPLLHRTAGMMGMAAARMLAERGLYGATHMGTGYDAWYPGYIDFINAFHNIVYMFSETGLHADYATPRFYAVRDFPEQDRELRPGTLRPSLWRGGWWRLRDSVDYMLTTSTATLDVAAKYRESMLYNRYQAGRDVIRAYTEGPPYAYFVPQQQRDPVAAVEMLRRLAFQNAEIHQLREAVTFAGISYPTATWVIPMNRANANFMRPLLNIQTYPDIRTAPDGPPDQPYDVAGWTLPYQMNVSHHRSGCAAHGRGPRGDGSGARRAGFVGFERRRGDVRLRSGAGVRHQPDCGRNRAAGRAHYRQRRGPDHRSGAEQFVSGGEPRLARGSHRALGGRGAGGELGRRRRGCAGRGGGRGSNEWALRDRESVGRHGQRSGRRARLAGAAHQRHGAQRGAAAHSDVSTVGAAEHG